MSKEGERMKYVEVPPNKKKYLEAYESEFNNKVKTTLEFLRSKNVDEQSIQALNTIGTEVLNSVKIAFKKLTKTVYEIGPSDANLKKTVATDHELQASNQAKMEEIKIAMKKLLVRKEFLEKEAKKQAEQIYSLLLRKIEAENQVRKKMLERATTHTTNTPQSSEIQSKTNLSMLEYEQRVKDLASMHNLRAKMMISSINVMMNCLFQETTEAIKRFVQLKASIEQQEKILDSGFESNAEYEDILFGHL